MHNQKFCSFINKAARSAFHWNGIMKTQLSQGANHEALETLSHMHRTSVQLDNFTFPIALKACTLKPYSTSLSLLEMGKQIHTLVIILGYQSDVYINNALVSFYCNYGLIEFGIKLFDQMHERSTVSWNSIITGCIRCGVFEKAIVYFSRMIFMSEERPDSFTMCTILNALAHLGVKGFGGGREIHGYIVRQGLGIETVSTIPFVENALINMYMESSCVSYAENVFKGMAIDKRDVVTWTTMINGYMRYKRHKLALALFRSMLEEERNVNLDPVTLVTVMPALTSLRQGKEVHCYALKCGFDSNVYVATSLLHMYAEYGSIESASKQFERVEKKNVVIWTAMITAYAKHGRSEDSLRLFDDMQKKGVTPNHLTFMGVLIAFSHSGLVDKAKECFNCMTQDYGLTPDMYHYAVMVDVLGRAGRLKDALEFIEAMPVKPTAPVWGSLMASCGLHQEVELGYEVAKIVAKLEPDNPGNLVLLSNMLAQGKRWDDASMVRDTMKQCGLKKVPGQSSLNVTN